jgi:Periplasmic serine proteases (ClpP class)
MNRSDMLARRLAARPLALAPRAFDALLGETPAPQAAGPGWEMTEGDIGHLPILGPLVQRGDWLTGMFGIMSYDDIAAAAEAAFTEPGTRAVLMEIDSPGGEVAGLFDLADRLAALKAETGKPLWAIAREQALSAAYLVGAVADRLFVTQTGEVGSVGVIAVHVDQTAHDQSEGRKYTLIHAGAKKVDGNPHIPLTPDARADIQADVDDLYARLVAWVARARGMSPEVIAATEAAIFRGQNAVAAGLADGIATLDGAHAALVATLETPPLTRTPKRESLKTERTDTMAVKGKPDAKPAATEETTEAGTAAPEMGATPEAASPAPVPAEEQIPAQSLTPAPSPAAAKPDPATQIREQAAEIAEIAAQASRLGLTVDAAEAVRAGTSPDAVRKAVLEQLAKTTDATIVASIAPSTAEPAPKESPLIAAAKAAAANATS